MADEYTPTVEDVRNEYARARDWTLDRRKRVTKTRFARFDRLMEKVIREAKAEVLLEVAQILESAPKDRPASIRRKDIVGALREFSSRTLMGLDYNEVPPYITARRFHKSYPGMDDLYHTYCEQCPDWGTCGTQEETLAWMRAHSFLHKPSEGPNV